MRAKRQIQKIKDKRERITGQDIIPVEEDEEPAFLKHSVEDEEVEVEQTGTGKQPPKPLDGRRKEKKQLDLGVDEFKATKIDLPLDLLDGKTTTPKGGDIKANKLIIQSTLEKILALKRRWAML